MGFVFLYKFTAQFKFMREMQKIVQLFDDLQQGECWVGLNMQQALSGIDAATAAYKRNENGNNIWQLVNHLIYWRKTVMIRLRGVNAHPPVPDFYLPDDRDELSWHATRQEFEKVYKDLRIAINSLDEKKLDTASPMPGQTYYQLLLGCLQHDAYHMGQIVLLKKG